MARKEKTVSIRIDPVTLAAMQMIAAKHRSKTGEGLTNDEVIWQLIDDAMPTIREDFERDGVTIPVDKREGNRVQKKDQQ